MNQIKAKAHIHLMGICGTAMASLAGLLKDRGYHVTGSDLNPYPPMSIQLENLGIVIQRPYRKENLHPIPDFVIVGNVISASNEEAQELLRLKIPYTSLPVAMGEFIIENRQCICVSGTHGKTTVTSMMAWVAQQCDQKPGFLIGGIAKNFSQSFQNPQGDFFVIEGDEYDTAFFDKVPKFVHYRPQHVILTSVEFDHADIYKDLEAVKEAFAKLLTLIPNKGTLLACAEDKNLMELRNRWIQQRKDSERPQRDWTYGLSQGDYRAQVIKISEKGTTFEVRFQNQLLGQFQVTLTGDYNVLNTLSVIAMAHQLNWDLDKVKKALVSFTGVKRRQEVLGEPQGILIIEDFAHHPTAVKETVKGIKAKYPERKIFSVFEPRSATSRRKIFQKDYLEAFQSSNEVLLAKAFDQSKINEDDRFSSEELVEDLRKSGRNAQAYDNVEQIVEALKAKTKKGDLILIMSNGGFDGIYGKLLKALGAIAN